LFLKRLVKFLFCIAATFSLHGAWLLLWSGPALPSHCDQPDPDAIKMFIGQIPKTWSENEIRELLEVYGHIYQLNVLREKGSVLSKGDLIFQWCIKMNRVGSIS